MSSRKLRLRNVTDFRGLEGAKMSPDRVTVKQEPRSPGREFSPAVDYKFYRCFDDLKLEPRSPATLPETETGSLSRPRPSLSMSDLASLRFDETTGQSTRYSRKPTRSSPPPTRSKFVSLAEAIYHFQRDTPGRFHTAAIHDEFKPQPGGALGRTLPQSPALRCATRARPVRLLTKEQREQIELEEIRKFKLKANPVPRSVVQGGQLPDVVRREKTVPEPFNLTQVAKKPPPSPQQEYVFHARPVPRGVLEKQPPPPKPQTHVTRPVTPTFLKSRAHSHEIIRRQKTPPPAPRVAPRAPPRAVEIPHGGVGQVATRPSSGALRPEPFSFEKRDECMRKKKDEKIKHIIREEKKLANQFKAQPVPKVVKKTAQAAVTSSKQSEASSTCSENKENFKFEARPPVVLTQKPFRPVLSQAQVTEQRPFELTTSKRASERENFDRQLREKEEEQQRLAEQREAERREAEERELGRLRALTVHHAQPVPDLVPFVPERSNAPLTEPQTPMFVRRLKKNNLLQK